MSYILEALRRSEQERSRGETPGVSTQHELPPLRAPADRRRIRVAWLLGGALLANAAVLAFWLLPDGSGEDARAVTTPAPTAVPTDSPAAPAVAASSAPAAMAAARQTPPMAAGTPPASARAATQATAARRTAPPRVTPASADAAPAGAMRDGTVTNEAEPEAATVAGAGVRAEADAPTDPDPRAGTQAAAAPSAPPAPLAIRDLPDGIQRRIPMLDFATHIFGDAPRYREVTINGRRYAEGERVEGMLLAEITETGVVFDYQGYRFEVSVLEDWDY